MSQEREGPASLMLQQCARALFASLVDTLDDLMPGVDCPVRLFMYSPLGGCTARNIPFQGLVFWTCKKRGAYWIACLFFFVFGGILSDFANTSLP